MAGIPGRITLEIVLVFGLGLPEWAGWCELGHHLAGPQARSVHIGDRFQRGPFLIFAGVVNARTVGTAAVIALTVRRGGIMDLEEEFQQITVGDALGVEDDFDRLGVGAMIAVGRVRYIAAAVADAS